MEFKKFKVEKINVLLGEMLLETYRQIIFEQMRNLGFLILLNIKVLFEIRTNSWEYLDDREHVGRIRSS